MHLGSRELNKMTGFSKKGQGQRGNRSRYVSIYDPLTSLPQILRHKQPTPIRLRGRMRGSDLHMSAIILSTGREDEPGTGEDDCRQGGDLRSPRQMEGARKIKCSEFATAVIENLGA